MKYFKTNTQLIQFNPSTNVYRVRNSSKVGSKVISEAEFNKLDVKKIGKQEFCELMNKFFASVKHEWVYDGVNYRKMDNFEKGGSSFSSNYEWHKLPRHLVGGTECIVVYHWGYVYFMHVSSNYLPKGLLVDMRTQELTNRWVDLKNVSPVFNINTKEII